MNYNCEYCGHTEGWHMFGYKCGVIVLERDKQDPMYNINKHISCKCNHFIKKA